MTRQVREQRKPIRYPGRQKLRLGPSGLRVELDPEDRDLGSQSWYLHSKGYVFRRTRGMKNGRLVYTGTVWLHREVARRICEARGLAMPGRVTFLNGARLDCRRENLVISRKAHNGR